jgi:predicted transcriptional regulator
MSDSTLTFRVDEELKSAFAAAAKAADRRGAQLLRDFMRSYVTEQREPPGYDAWFRAEVQLGIEAANSGKLVSGEKVEAEFARRRAVSRQKLGGDAD